VLLGAFPIRASLRPGSPAPCGTGFGGTSTHPKVNPAPSSGTALRLPFPKVRLPETKIPARPADGQRIISLSQVGQKAFDHLDFGGEMVPHEAIEQKIIDVLGLSGRDERPVAIVGVQDEAKGEALVLLSAVDIDVAELRKKLQEAGVPNLWIPKQVQRIEAIPVLASGKLDLKRCQQCVTER